MRLQVCSMCATSAGSRPSANWFCRPQRLRYSSSHFASIGRDLRLVRRHFAEDQLADRKDLQPQVAHQADVEFAALDVFLRDHVARRVSRE